MYQGNIFITSREVGYVTVEGFEEDIEIEPRFLNTALHGDLVEILIHPKESNQRLRGEVVSIIERAKTEFVGTLEKSNGFFFLLPDDRRMYRDIFISQDSAKKGKDGEKALVEIIGWKDKKKNPEGKVLKVFGKKGEHGVEMHSIIYEKGFQTDFPTEVESEAQDIAKNYKKEKWLEKELKKRKDFRETPTFTIDPETAKDFDDALSIKEVGKETFEIGIHIADVSFFVREKSALDREASKRATSVYLVDRTIPMLPEILSNDLCSLNPDEEKLAFSAVFKMNLKGEVLERWFGRTVIKSQKRFSYQDAQKILDEKKGQYLSELEALNKIAHKLKEEKFKNGAIDFESDEVGFKLDKSNNIVDIYRKERLDTHKLIEEFMLLANREVAKFFHRAGKKSGAKEEKKDKKVGHSGIYRVHDLPDKEKISELGTFLKALGYEVNWDSGKITAKEMNTLLEKVVGKSHESLVKTAAIRSMSKAVYSTQNIGHFGLSFDFYTHFTSPIRRYPDLIVHRILQKYLNGQKIGAQEFSKFQVIAQESTAKEISASEAERESIKFKQVEYMQNHIGETFEAIISGVTEWGIYVEEVKTKSDGMVRLSSIEEDFYSLDKKNYAMVGEKKGKRYTLGDKVKVRLENADLDSRTLDFVFV